MSTYGYGIYLSVALVLRMTSMVSMLPLCICLGREGSGRLVRFHTKLTAPPASSCIIWLMEFTLPLHFSFLRSPTPARLHIALHPARHVTVESTVTVAKAVAILHNIVTEKRRNGYVSRTRMAAAAQAAAGGSGGGDAVGGGAGGVGIGAVETPAAAGGAAGGVAGDEVGKDGGGGTGFTPNGGAPAAGVGAACGGAGGGGGGGTGLMPDGGGHAAGVGAAVGGAAGGGGGGTGLTADGGSHAAGGGAAGGSPQSNAKVLGVATGRQRVWPPLSSHRPARSLPEVLVTR